MERRQDARLPVGGTYAIEPDASNASYFSCRRRLIVPGSQITIAGLGKNSFQGDVAFAGVLEKIGGDGSV